MPDSAKSRFPQGATDRLQQLHSRELRNIYIL
jgi:hypothetical protein